jgi:hypothetical protein
VAPLDEIAAFGVAHFNTFDEDRIPADIPVRFAGEGSEAPAFVELYVLDDIDAIGIGVGRHGLSKKLKESAGKFPSRRGQYGGQ